MKMITVAVLASALLLTACARTKLVHTNDANPLANHARDTAFCENEAIRVVPPAPTRITVAPAAAPSPESYSTNCSKWGSETNCTTTARAAPQSTSKFAAFMDGYNKGEANRASSNSDDIAKYTKNCLALKGWTSIRVPR